MPAMIRLLVLAVVASVAALSCRTDAAPVYDVRVAFRAAYDPNAPAVIEAAIRDIDPDAQVRVQETSPPTLVATLSSRREDVCEAILRSTATRTDIASLNCQRRDASPTPASS